MPTTVEIFVERRPGGAGQPSEVDAFADLYNRTYNPLVAYCRRYCPPGYDPEDIAQEALAKAWSSWDRYSPSRPFWPWVATIARRLCVDYWRRDERALARAGGAAALEPCPQPRPDELTEAADECRMAVTAFRRLRPDHQRIVGLRDIEGWSYEDIARFEGVTVESIRGSLRRARLSLRKSYDTVAKGGVPVFAPLAALLKSFETARARVASRMARWQATMQDAGVASTRLGEALVSLMAITVAAVGVGGPTSGVALRADSQDAGAEVAESGLAAAAPAGPAKGSADSASSGNASTVKGAILNGEFGKTEYDPSAILNPLGPTNPNNEGFLDFAASPAYRTDGTIFAVSTRGACAMVCHTVFKSSDRGVSWRDMQTAGLVGTKLLLPPAYPHDSRIFATGSVGLQVSYDHGKSFTTVLPSRGTAAMSPAFSSGDPRIFLPDAPGLQYDADRNLIEPMNLRPGPSSASHQFSFGFPTRYDPANPVMFVGTSVPGGTRNTSAIYRCERSACGAPVVLPDLMKPADISVVPMKDGRDAILAIKGSFYFRSLDGGATFTRMSWPKGLEKGSLLEATDGAGRIYVLAPEFEGPYGDIWYSDDGGATWANMPDPGGTATQVMAIGPLPDGGLVVALRGHVAGFACSYDGRTWSPSCPSR